MSDKFFVGLDLTGVEDNGLQRPISRVTLLLDDENSVTAGDDTGAELLADCPHATQEMVNAILAQVKGYQYRMLSADDAALDPSAELGDGVTAGGLYSVISRLADDGSGYSGISAPGESELEDEYPAGGPMAKEFDRKIAKTRSQILKTAEQITLRVENEIDGLRGELELTASSLTAQIRNAEGEIGQLELTATLLQSQISNAVGDLSYLRQTVDSISLGVVNGSESSTITMYKNGIAVSSQNISFTGMVTFNDLNGSAGTIINGSAINTGTLRLDSLYGSNIYINDYYGMQAGLITTVGATSYYGQKIYLSSGAIEIGAGAGDIYLRASNGTLQIGGGQIAAGGDCVPYSDNYFSLGRGGLRWSDVYAVNGTIITSDREKKKDIVYGLDRYGALFDRLKPVSYRLKDGQRGRTHLGLIAQDVEAALAACGLSDMDFAGFIKSPVKSEDGDEMELNCEYALRYGEFIPMCIARIQELTARVTELERRLAA